MGQEHQQRRTKITALRCATTLTFGAMAATGLAAGCQSSAPDSHPTPLESSTTASAATASPAAKAPSPPVMRKQAREDSPEGAAAFVYHYIKVLNYAAATGDVDELKRLSSPNCTGCARYIALYRDTYKAGGYFIGGEWSAEKLNLEFDGAKAYVTTKVSTGGAIFRENSDAAEKRSTRDRTSLRFVVPSDGSGRQLLQFSLA